MKNHSYNGISPYCWALNRPSTSDVIAALGLTASVGFVGLLVFLNR